MLADFSFCPYKIVCVFYICSSVYINILLCNSLLAAIDVKKCSNNVKIGKDLGFAARLPVVIRKTRLEISIKLFQSFTALDPTNPCNTQ